MPGAHARRRLPDGLPGRGKRPSGTGQPLMCPAEAVLRPVCETIHKNGTVMCYQGGVTDCTLHPPWMVVRVLEEHGCGGSEAWGSGSPWPAPVRSAAGPENQRVRSLLPREVARRSVRRHPRMAEEALLGQTRSANGQAMAGRCSEQRGRGQHAVRSGLLGLGLAPRIPGKRRGCGPQWGLNLADCEAVHQT